MLVGGGEKEYIAAGDIFQVVLSQRWDFEPGVAPLDLYRALRTVNPSPYMYYCRLGDMTVVGSSPEALVKLNGREASSPLVCRVRCSR